VEGCRRAAVPGNGQAMAQKGGSLVSEGVLVALLSLLGTLGGAFGGIMVANRLVNYRLEQLEKKVDQHNLLIDRMYCAEKRLDVMGEQLKTAVPRMDTLGLC